MRYFAPKSSLVKKIARIRKLNTKKHLSTAPPYPPREGEKPLPTLPAGREKVTGIMRG